MKEKSKAIYNESGISDEYCKEITEEEIKEIEDIMYCRKKEVYFQK